MTNDWKLQYLNSLLGSYQNSSKGGKNKLLDEFCRSTGYSRKHAIRLFNKSKVNFLPKSGRPKKYSEESKKFAKKLWILMGQMNGKNMKAALPYWLRSFDDPECTMEIRKELLEMSATTLDRVLKRFKVNFVKRKFVGTIPSLMKKLIPIKSMDFRADQPGYLQIDTVAHCGGSLEGVFIWSLTVVDEVLGWTENKAIWGKTAYRTINALEAIEKELPIKIKSINMDGGTEFINDQMLKFANTKRGDNRILLTRSRPYKKNDSCFVEQKNFTHVRQLFGWERFDHEELVEVMNEIYRLQGLLQNYFVPQMRLKNKWREGAKYHRQYHPPITPYEALQRNEQIDYFIKGKTKDTYLTLNPFKLQEQIEENLIKFYKLLKELDDKRRESLVA